MFFVKRAIVLGFLLLAGPAMAEGIGGAGFSSVQTARVVDGLKQDFATCRRIDVAYRLDCYRQAYSASARILSNNAAYWEAKVALLRVDRQLRAVMSQATDRSADRIREGGRRFYAVETGALPQAAEALRSSVTRAESLLRSGTDAEITNFAAIADVVATSADLYAN